MAAVMASGAVAPARSYDRPRAYLKGPRCGGAALGFMLVMLGTAIADLGLP